jgi:NIPSNAP
VLTLNIGIPINICAKLNICTLNAPTSPIPKPLVASFEQHLTTLESNQMDIIEIRTYTIIDNERDNFHNLFVDELIPLLNRWKINVVSFGKSLHDKSSFFLIRQYPNSAEREKTLNDFYNSEEWLTNYDKKITVFIKNYTTTVLPLTQLNFNNLS